MKRLRLLGIAGLALLVGSIVACSKEDLEEGADAESALRSGEANVEGMHHRGKMGFHHGPDVFRHLRKMGNFCGDREWPEGAVVTGDEGAYPRTVTVEFEGRKHGPRGMHGKGKGMGKEMADMPAPQVKITIEKSDDLKSQGAVHVYRTEMTGGDKFQGSGEITVTNQGPNAAGEWVIAINGTHNHEGPKGSFTNSFSGSKTWKKGFETEDCSDDEVWLTGQSEGTGPEGRMMGGTINEPFVKLGSCDFPVSGKATVNRGDKEVMLDFGDGTCDAILSITKDGETEEIDLSEVRKRCEK